MPPKAPQSNGVKIAVVFRKRANGRIVALFPSWSGPRTLGSFVSYESGRYFEDDHDRCVRKTKPAKRSEYGRLKAELERECGPLRVLARRRLKEWRPTPQWSPARGLHWTPNVQKSF